MPPRSEQGERTCIVDRTALSADRMIRFVAAPDGTVVADLRRRLPGRGVWVTADAEHVRAAENKRLFRRGLGETTVVEPGLADRVADSLREAALAALSFARKAGSAVFGFTRVEAAIADGSAIALIHAAEAKPDGVAKLAAAVRRNRNGVFDLPVIRFFTSDELDLAFGRTHVIHAALLAGPASSNVLKRVRAHADFVGGDGRVGWLESRDADPSTHPRDRRNS